MYSKCISLLIREILLLILALFTKMHLILKMQKELLSAVYLYVINQYDQIG